MFRVLVFAGFFFAYFESRICAACVYRSLNDVVLRFTTFHSSRIMLSLNLGIVCVCLCVRCVYV